MSAYAGLESVISPGTSGRLSVDDSPCRLSSITAGRCASDERVPSAEGVMNGLRDLVAADVWPWRTSCWHRRGPPAAPLSRHRTLAVGDSAQVQRMWVGFKERHAFQTG